jgi:small-conductance mechanosensitive channel
MQSESLLLQLKEGTIPIFFNAFGESALNLELLCWIKEPALRLRTVDEINRGIYKRFDELGIRIPFPQRDVHIYQDRQ